MISLILRSKTFFLSLIGIAAAVFLILKTNQKLPAQVPYHPPARNLLDGPVVAGSGIVESFNENIRLSSAVSGLVDEVLVVPAQKVRAGDLLLKLDQRHLKGQLLVYKTQEAKLEARHNRVSRLQNPAVLSEEERDTIEYDLKIVRSEIKRLELLLDQLELRAPVEGSILQVNVRKGEYLSVPMNTGSDYTPPILMTQGDQLQIRTDIDEIQASLIKPGVLARAVMKGGDQTQSIDLEFLRIEPFVIPKKSLTGSNAERADTRVLQVLFKVKETKVPLYYGQQVDVSIQRKSTETQTAGK